MTTPTKKQNDYLQHRAKKLSVLIGADPDEEMQDEENGNPLLSEEELQEEEEQRQLEQEERDREIERTYEEEDESNKKDWARF